LRDFFKKGLLNLLLSVLVIGEVVVSGSQKTRGSDAGAVKNHKYLPNQTKNKLFRG
jgi:hypothetical protein